MNLVARIILDIVITLMFKFVYNMVCSDEVIAVNEEPRAVMHVLFGKGHGDERKDDYDEVFHDASVGCILCIIIVGSSANVKPIGRKIL